ncbi:hypothetical protein Scep_021177 [Stephania cephalantha]|uniref:Uncharacterized protein n=1 Tax=Stephania cephalantha TaxID=152367 RepID=A0AAP0FAC0_9MAGN
MAAAQRRTARAAGERRSWRRLRRSRDEARRDDDYYERAVRSTRTPARGADNGSGGQSSAMMMAERREGADGGPGSRAPAARWRRSCAAARWELRGATAGGTLSGRSIPGETTTMDKANIPVSVAVQRKDVCHKSVAEQQHNTKYVAELHQQQRVNQYALSRQQNDCNCTQCTAAHHKKTPAGHWPPPTFTLVRRLRISKLKHMERLMGRESPNKDSRRSSSLQKQVVENHRRFSHRPAEPVPDVAELMDDWFFGSGNVKTNQNKNYLSTSAGAMDDDHDQEQQVLLEDSPRNSNSRMTQEWLEEAKRIVAESPTRYDSPSRLVGSPRFASSSGPSDLDRRDPLSRSARRHRGREGFSGEILSRSAKHSRNKSESLEGQGIGIGEPDSPQWLANNLGHQTLADHLKQPNSKEEEQALDQTIQGKPPRLPVRKSRFQEIPITTQSVGSSPTMPRRNFRSSSSSGQLNDDQHQLLLSPPKSLTEPAHRRSLSSSTSNEDKLVLSPPRRLVESIQRRSISSSTCSIDKIPSRQDSKGIMSLKEEDVNMFLKEQRSKMYGISSGEIHDVKAKIVLSGSSNS